LNWTKATGTGLEAIKTKVFKEITTQTTSTTPKPSSTETTTPEVKQAEKTSVDSLAEPIKKTERKVQTQPATGQIPTDNF
jgi:hypothetical protein